MYKLALCCLYLWTRYLALVCVTSVMLGVATLIVVNSVMSGFSTKLKDRLHRLLSDMAIETRYFDGLDDPDRKMAAVRKDPWLNEHVVAMTPTIEVFAMIQFQYQGQMIAKPVRLIGIDAETRGDVGGFREFLVDPANRANPSFELRGPARTRFEQNQLAALWEPRLPPELPSQPEPVYTPTGITDTVIRPPFERDYPAEPPPRPIPPPTPPTSTPHKTYGVIVGHAIASYRKSDPHDPTKFIDEYALQPGDEVVLTTVKGQRLAPAYDSFAVCDYFKSEMSEYDSNYVFVPLKHLQELRGMGKKVTSIQLKLKNYADAEEVNKRLQNLQAETRVDFSLGVSGTIGGAAACNGRTVSYPVFPDSTCNIMTWEAKQGPLLAAIAIERGLLNVLLFLIIAVAGFGILAIFSMIVTEKTRDIGIIKALGASNGGVMSIFLGYGLLLGLVGAGLGTGLGLSITVNINKIEQLLTKLTGQQIFDRKVYYFSDIPTDIQTWSIVLVNLGAIIIAVLFSVLPALRAALLHPVRALRYE